MKFTHVSGNETVPLRLFTLSTCIWCKKTKAFLKEHGIAFDYIDVDLLDGEALEEIDDFLNGQPIEGGYPIVFAGDDTIICGFHPDKMEELLGL